MTAIVFDYAAIRARMAQLGCDLEWMGNAQQRSAPEPELSLGASLTAITGRMFVPSPTFRPIDAEDAVMRAALAQHLSTSLYGEVDTSR